MFRDKGLPDDIPQYAHTWEHEADALVAILKASGSIPSTSEGRRLIGQGGVKVDGRKAHSTQKPEALLYRIILAASNPGDVVLDPFFGSGTTGVTARRLGRHWIGIEKDPTYVKVAQERLDAIAYQLIDPAVFDVRSRKQRQPRLPFGALLESGLLKPGQWLYFRADRKRAAQIKPDGRLKLGDFEGSIHQAGVFLMNGSPCNGWDNWYYENEQGELRVIDELRERLRGA